MAARPEHFDPTFPTELEEEEAPLPPSARRRRQKCFRHTRRRRRRRRLLPACASNPGIRSSPFVRSASERRRWQHFREAQPASQPASFVRAYVTMPSREEEEGEEDKLSKTLASHATHGGDAIRDVQESACVRSADPRERQAGRIKPHHLLPLGRGRQLGARKPDGRNLSAAGVV